MQSAASQTTRKAVVKEESRSMPRKWLKPWKSVRRDVAEVRRLQFWVDMGTTAAWRGEEVSFRQCWRTKETKCSPRCNPGTRTPTCCFGWRMGRFSGLQHRVHDEAGAGTYEETLILVVSMVIWAVLNRGTKTRSDSPRTHAVMWKKEGV